MARKTSLREYHASLWADLTRMVVDGTIDSSTAVQQINDRWNPKKQPSKTLELNFTENPPLPIKIRL